MSTFGTPPGLVGFTGVCQLEISGIASGVFGSATKIIQPRVTSCDLGLKQAIVLPNATNPSFGRMIFNVQPEIIDGNIEYPIVVNDKDASGDVTPHLWDRATQRDYNGRLTPINIYVKGANYGASFKYIKCFVNTFGFAIKQGDPTIKVSAGFMGMDRQELQNISPILVKNSRALGWADGIVGLFAPGAKVTGESIRSFNIEVANNCERYYTGAKTLKVKDIVAKNFDVTGTIILMGRHPYLAQYSLNNPTRYLETSYLEFGYSTACTPNCPPNTSFGIASVITPCNKQWKAQVPAVLFQIEEMSLTNDVFESVVKWSSAPSDNTLSSYSVFR